MGTFRSERTYWGEVPGLDGVAADLAHHFRDKKFDVVLEDSIAGGWDISISRGRSIRAILGLKLALKVLLTPDDDTLVVTAGIGLFGRQMAPAALSVAGIRIALLAAGATAASLVALPLIATQAWGLIRAAKLDNEAMAVVHESISRIAPEVALRTGPPITATVSTPVVEALAETRFCTACGATTDVTARFCGSCGTAQS
ncbi:hypothetical protein Lfu02_33300 [Longispora fulva]|uniref:Zinc ribbon domain-containing protein n=1 Tax=Longispora fulva TaxID=619741 RepID=A0A8J7H0J8_9ACTN|nr:zinc ribbon domain-containing protein [Longispora fulva]MBG6141886.1 hypothetical protein [Longispora fulva]GIG58958.1 hypothetical protein Lfu02_33300 [Longispora fulva]